jgi:hypothetical protein
MPNARDIEASSAWIVVDPFGPECRVGELEGDTTVGYRLGVRGKLLDE